MGDTELLMPLVLAGAICLLGVSIGFNRPSWSRTYTTAARYRRALLIHGLLYLMVFLVAYFVARKLWAVPAIALVWPVLMAVLILRLLWSWPKAWLHEVAGIPRHANDLAAMLTSSELQPPDRIVEEARATLASRGVDVDADWLPLAKPTHQLLMRATMLFLQIRQWEMQRQFTGFMCEARNEVNLLRRRFDRLSLRVSRSLASIERLGEVRHLYSAHDDRSSDKHADVLLRKIVGDLLADSCEDIRAFYEDACLLTARAVYMTRSSNKGRNALLRTLGFELSEQRGKVSHGFLITTAVLLYAGIWMLFQWRPTGQAGAPAFLTPVVSIIAFGSLVIAIVPKLHWGFANSGLHERTPWLFVAGAGLCAMLFAVVVQLCAGALLIGGMEGALDRLQRGSPWIPGMFVIASTMAWLVQDHRWRRISSALTRRLLDAVTFGAAWAVAGILGAVLKAQMFGPAIDSMTLLLSTGRSFLLGVLISQVTAEYARRRELREPLRPSRTILADVSSLTKPRPAAA